MSERLDAAIPKGRTLRQHAARGTLINGAFMTGLGVLSLLRGFVVAAFVTTSDYGLWGVLIVTIGTLVLLKQVGIGDRFIAQDEPDQELAYHRAFTLELLLTLVVSALLLALLPLFALAYGQPELLAPGLVVIAALPAIALQTPVWVYYRRMQFVRQRTLQAVDPIVAFGVTLGLAIAGAGYWAFVIGFFVGAWSAALVAVLAAPVRPRWSFDRAVLRSYAAFSWPLFIAALGGVVVAQAAVFGTETHLGIAAVGALTLAITITQFTARVDQLVTETLYPAICAVRDRTELLLESFVKSNRLALMWGVPFGVGVSLFCADLVAFGIGDRWEPAIELMQVFGVVAAVGQIGFNWDAYFRALGQTRPMAISGVAAAATFLVVGIPLLLAFGLRGLAAAIALQTAVDLTLRARFLRRIFPGLRFLRHALRGFLPTIPAVAVVLLIRAAESGERTLAVAIGEAVIYLTVTASVTWFAERPLLREAFGYLTGRRAAHVAA